MKLLTAIFLLLIYASSLVSSQEAVEATTAIKLPIDSATIYPDGMVSIKRIGIMDVTEGDHDFLFNTPEAADKSTVLLSVSNSTIERVVYDGNPVYTLNVSSSGKQDFVLSYLMNGAGHWAPRYDLHLANDSLFVNAEAMVRISGGEDLRGVRLKLAAGLPREVRPIFVEKATQMQMASAARAPPEEMPLPETSATGELETLYIFELDGRKDIDIDKEIGLPLFESNVPLIRIYTWDAYNYENGPVLEEITANNTIPTPWPAGMALLYRNDEYVTTFTMPYTPTGTNASIVVGPSPDLKVVRILKDYNMTERTKKIDSADNKTRDLKEITENWTYKLKIDNNQNRSVILAVNDIKPKKARIIFAEPKPEEITATDLKWKIALEPRQKRVIDNSYHTVTTEPDYI